MGDSYELRGKYAEIDRSDSPSQTLRPSLEDAYRSSTDDDDVEDVDEFDPLNYDEGTLKRKKAPRRQRNGGYEDVPGGSKQNQLPFTQPRRPAWKRWLIPSRMCCYLILLFVATTVLLLSAGGIWAWKSSTPQDGQSPPWYPSPKGGADDAWTESYKKAADLVKQMSLVEKVNITTGVGWSMEMCVGNTGQVGRLGFPSLCLQDGPLGIRFADNITAFPAGVTLGSTWNKELMYQKGKAHGTEARLKGVNVLLGPSMGPLGRMPAGGRNWEGFGADPVLQGIASAQMIKGIQDVGVIATAKHYIANEQEHFRQAWEYLTPNAISSNIDDRTLHEIYAWPFAESVKAGVASVMCSYNQINNSYACGNSKLLNGILKDELGFQGFVQSDWLAQRSGVGSALAGLDMSMPGDGLGWQDGKALWGKELTKAVLNTSMPMERLNDMVTRIVAAWYQLGQDNKEKWPMPPPDGDGGPNFSSWTNDEVGLLHPGSDDKTIGVVNKFVNATAGGETVDAHTALARRIAAEGIVLLKNEDSVLPLSRSGGKDNDGAEKYRVGVFGEDAIVNPKGPNACNDRACNVGTLGQGWGSGTVEYTHLVSPLDAIRNAFNDSTVYVTDLPKNDMKDSQNPIFEEQDLCIVFVSSDGGEGYMKWKDIAGDRNNMHVQNGGDDLVKRVAGSCGKGNGKTIVVLHAVGPVIMEEWVDLPGVKAVLLAHLPGQESGSSLVDVLFGDLNPSGHLPYTIAKKEEDYGPGGKIMYKASPALSPQQNFSEGLYIDYRHFDKYNITPRYPFGFGLSYTTFHLNQMAIQQTFIQRTLLPKPRPFGPDPPAFDTTIPDPETALWPKGMRKLKKYIYPYIDSVKDIKKGDYPYPEGYDVQSPLSAAGGAQGGNPDLYTILANVSVTVTNLGTRTGQAVVQLYVGFPEDWTDTSEGGANEPIDFPVKVLRQWEKMEVQPGGNKRTRVHFSLTRKDLSYWDVKRQNWAMPTKGSFKVWLGFDSVNFELKPGLIT